MTVTADAARVTDRAGCGCPDFTLSRRRFLAATAGGAGAMAAGSLFGDAYRQVAYGAERGGNVVVVLSLRGGCDGLSMVVPRTVQDHDRLRALRPKIVVPRESLLGSDPGFGLHPAFQPLLPMWEAGGFGAVHAVGLPAPNRSHFDAMEVIEDSDVGTSERVGWINRTVGLDLAAPEEAAVQLGSSLLPTSLSGPAPAIGAAQVADLGLYDLGAGASLRRRSLEQMWGAEKGLLGRSMRGTLATVERLAPMVAGAAEDAPGGSSVRLAAYPEGPLSQVLANTSALIRADVGTRVVTVDYGNWDMHNGLGGSDPTKGWMADQVGHLAGSLAAFFADLGPAASRVTVVTLSEFGRRVKENGDSGVDHGYGNVMLLLGAGVQGGTVHGAWPGLATLTDGDLAVTRDHRSVLWEVLSTRFPDVSGSRAEIFPSFVPESVGAMR